MTTPPPTAPDERRFENPQRVEFDERRWEVRIKITDAAGELHVFVASADNYYTERDHIWFDTLAETEGFDG